MNRKQLMALPLVVAMLASGVAFYGFSGVEELTAEEAMEETMGELNYYRIPGGDPWCEDPCDGAVCCDYPI